MKIKYLTFLLCISFCVHILNAQTTAVPDSNFENYLETHDQNGGEVSIGDDTSMGDGIDGNGLVFTERINSVVSLTINNLSIETLIGIEGFSSLETLICNGNNLSTLDVANNTNLKTLLCASNQLDNLNISANNNLEDIDCSDNQISLLDVYSNQSLIDLRCSDNRILDIDVSQNVDLTSLSVSNNRLSTLDVGNNTKLESLYCASNQITNLDLSSNTYLKVLDASNNLISNLDLSTINTVACPDPQTDPVTVCQGASSINVSNNQLTSLIVANGFNDLVTSFTSEGNPDLACIQVDIGFTPNATWIKDDWAYYTETTCTDIYTYVPDDNFEQALIDLGYDDVMDNLVLRDNINAIGTLDISNLNIDNLTGIEDFIALETLNFSGNNIEALDISMLTALTNLNASNNALEGIDLSNNLNLTFLNISNNNLENLDVNSNLSLGDLNCSNNNILSLDLSGNTNLTDFNCASNTLELLNLKNGQNGNLVNFDATANANLSCIETDTGAVPGGVTWSIDTTASYAINCGTYVPDDGFEQAIIDAGFDVGPLDNYVPTANIIGETNLNVSGYNIVDLTGIEDFAALQVLDCSNNTIVELNLTANNALTSVTCNNNTLEFLDLRNGSNNPQLVTFNATNNPNLFCVNVDDANYSQNAAGWLEDALVIYNTDCQNNRYTPIPDDNFEQALIDLGLDSGPLDNQVLTANIEYLTSLNVSGENIESLEGIKAFLSLTELDCSDNYLDELDVSGMINLEELYCSSNYLLTNIAGAIGALNTTGTPSLRKLFCSDNNLADLDISLNTNLAELDCSNNSIASLDISNNNSLIEISCNNNEISNFTSYTANNSTLTKISCNNNALSTLAVNRCLALTTLNCRSNSLSLLDISANGFLEVLDFSDNQLTDIDLSGGSLIAVSGSQNQLTNVNDLTSAFLESLILDNNEITDFTVLNTLKYISISNNQLSDLDVSANTNLIELNVSNNQLTNLLLSTNLNQLKTLNCSNNEITGDFDLSSMGIGACPAQNANNPLDFCPDNITINVSGNQLEFINIQNGINNEISNFSATNNPELYCIQVDDINNIGESWAKDTATEYSIDCRFGETYVPDDNFEQALIALGYDIAPLDDYVTTATIEVLTELDVSGNSIQDLTGIEDFTALQNLNCSSNNLSTIDISKNTNLTEINCSNNELATLDVTETQNIININISNNLLIEFDASLLPALQSFNCDSNNIVELYFTTNTSLTNLSCASNLLEVLDLQNGQNPNLSNLNAQNNPDLSCIQTDNGNAPGGVAWLKDATTEYAINCRFGETFVPDDNFEQALIDLGYDVAPLDDYVPTPNIETLRTLSLSEKEISDLTGIEDFVSLTSLNIEGNTLETIDLSANVLLNSLNVSNNQFSTINISNLTVLRVLDVSNNSLSEINTDSNLGLTELNISDNLLTTLDVSLLLNLRRLNCSSNQLEALDVTANNKLIELFCTSNAFIQDKLNIQNGANTILRTFNASNNPDLSCILVDDPVAVISNVDGSYDNWFKDATTNYQAVCDDADNDGVANEDDLCPGTPFGEPVDLFGCRFSILPEDNFTILITDETCLNNNNGIINIRTKELYEYKAHVTNDIFDKEYTFTNEINILNMLAGTYSLCITSEDLPNFQRCFEVVINHPANLDVITSKSNKGKEATFNLSGSSSYHIDFNGLKFTTSKSQLTLQLENGKNTIKISTDLPCQGVHEENILLSNNMFAHPNPFKDEINLYLGDLDSDNAEVTIYSYLGQMVLFKRFNVENIRTINIDTQQFKSGIYTVSVRLNNAINTFKIAKK